MTRILRHQAMGKGSLDWLQTYYHFSFADYYNQDNIQFGALRVINDDTIAPHTGFSTHPHRDMEIVTYVLEGELTHADSMDNQRTLSRGGVQYLSAGTGIWHSEENVSDQPVRLLQIWILPDRKNHRPNYGDYTFPMEARKGQWLHFVSSKAGEAEIQINQEADFFARVLKKDEGASFSVPKGKMAYVVQAEGEGQINGETLFCHDALESIEEDLSFRALSDEAHYVVILLDKA